MGSIAGLRSESLSLRAKEDTNLQIASHLGGVNKSLGSQITSMMDSLQGVISERTKAYNGLVTKLNQSIGGKGGTGDTAVQLAFQGMKVLIEVISSTVGVAAAVGPPVVMATIYGVIAGIYAIQIAAQSAIPPYVPDPTLIKSMNDALQNAKTYGKAAALAISANSASIADATAHWLEFKALTLKLEAAGLNLHSAIYDYEKMASQLGTTGTDNPSSADTNDPNLAAGATALLRKRDSMMVRYKPHEVNYQSMRGYVGTLRRV